MDALTLEDVETDFWAHRYYDNPPAESSEDDEWNLEKLLADAESGEWEDVIGKA